MAFILTPTASPSVRMSARCSARSARPARRSSSRRSNRSRNRQRAARVDAIPDDNEQDSTDITTYASCPICFKSLMLRPERLINGPIELGCSCCGQKTTVSLEQLENMDGSVFDLDEWLRVGHEEAFRQEESVVGDDGI